MKYTPLLFIAAAIACIFSSCGHKKITCYNYQLYKLRYYTNAATDSISDTSATFVSYSAGTGFARPTGSAVSSGIGIDPIWINGAYRNYWALYIPYTEDLFYTSDFLITLHPSGREYRLTAIKHDSRYETQSENDEISCTNNLYYKINDSLYTTRGGTTTGNSIMPATMYVRY